jgi:translation initiation factor IF-2
MESKALMTRLTGLGIELASHQSTMTDEQVAKFRAAEASDSSKSKVVVRRRKKVEETSAEDSAHLEASTTEHMEEVVQAVTASEIAVPVAADPVEDVVTPPVGQVRVSESVAIEVPKQVRPELKRVEAEVTAVPVEDETEKAKPRRRFEGGATIVRRATPEEIAEQKAREEARQRTARKEDSRGVRVTGIGVSTQGTQGTQATQAESGGARPQGAPAEAGARQPTEFTGRKRTGVQPETAPKEEEDQLALNRKAVGIKGRTQSTRELLSQLEVGSDDIGKRRGAANNRRTVYTPNSAQRKRDLKRRKDLKSTEVTTPRAAYLVVKMQDTISIGDLGKQMGVKAGELIKSLMNQGVMATINQQIDFDTTSLLASEHGFEVKLVTRTMEDVLQRSGSPDYVQVTRPPIVTVMGHVDHGKTSILDALRKTEVAAGEAGGITQHIGAYTVTNHGRTIAFLDTPGHEAFSAMRSRGAGITDIVILVVAADDGVMPQTIEAISHARSANVPIIVAINKIDKPNINLDRVFTELTEHGIQSEEWGGDTQFVKVSALQGIGMDELLDAVHLQADILELTASPDAPGEGAVVEGHLDKGQGPVATVMVTTGSLKKGDLIVAGTASGRVRVMINHHGERLDIVGPSTPVQVIGLTDVPMAGDKVNVVEDEKVAKMLVDLRLEHLHNANKGKSSAATLEELLAKVKLAGTPEVPLIIKADTQGSVEALAETILKLNTDRVANRIVHKAVGGINESDINLADTSGAVILGFNVRASRGLDDFAEKKGVLISYFSIIYELVDTVKSLMVGKLPPIRTEVVQGHAEVRNAISVPRIGTVAGSAVLDGKITRSSSLRLIRDQIVIFEGKLGSLRRFKDDVREVQNGYECGIALEGYNDIKVGDVIEAYTVEESKATL